MNETGTAQKVRWVVGGSMVLVGASVFLIRFQHAGPYGFPAGGNLIGGILALLIGGVLLLRKAGGPISWLVLAASPVVMFFALYATLAELEEVVVLEVIHESGSPADLRLWVVDRDGHAWVTMPRAKADAHGLTDARVELLRDGELRCVITTRFGDHETVNAIHELRHEKYAIQRLATAIGLFGSSAGDTTVALRLDPCPGSSGP